MVPFFITRRPRTAIQCTRGDGYFLGANRVRRANLAIRAAIACLTDAELSHAPQYSVGCSRSTLDESLQPPPSLAEVSQTVHRQIARMLPAAAVRAI